jgi:drug/metabolite transporter (DMT)-like permease
MHSLDRSRTNLAAVLALALLAVSWGAIPLIVRSGVPPTQLVAMRVTLGGVVLLVAAALTGRLRWPETDRWRVVILGVMLGAHWLTFFLAIQRTTVAVALAVVYLGPVLAVVLSGPILGERGGRRVFVGLGLAVTGTLLVVRPGSGATTTGFVIALVSAALLAALMLIGAPAARSLGGLTVATWELVVAAVLLAPFSVEAVRESAEYWPQFLLLGALFTGVAGVVYWSAMRRLPVAVVGVIMYLEPASAVVWATLFLDETPDALAWVGVAFVVAGGVLAAIEGADTEAAGAPAVL